MLEQLTREMLRIPADDAALPAELAYGSGALQRLILLLNPHPHMGGAMQNNLVKHLALRLAGRGNATLRFDYRSVGQVKVGAIDLAESMAQFWRTGHAPEDPLLVDDARRVLEWARQQVCRSVVLIGYSFGSSVASHVLDDEVAAVAVISPTVQQHDLARLAAAVQPKLVIYSDDDFANSANIVERWSKALRPPTEMHCLNGAKHFYRGMEQRVEELCQRWLEGTC